MIDKIIFYDADFLICFLTIGETFILKKAFNEIIVPMQVFKELTRKKSPNIVKETIIDLRDSGFVKVPVIKSNSRVNIAYRAIKNGYWHDDFRKLGKGESAALAFAIEEEGVIASNNFDDIKEYVDKYELMFFEKVFEMESGYVLNFTDNSFKDFVKKSIGIDIYNEDFITKVEAEYPSSSKKNILKYIWNNESEDKVFKIVYDLIEYYDLVYENSDDKLLENAKKIIGKHSQPNLEITNDFSEYRIKELEKEINKIIFAIDRLHVFMQNYLRTIFELHGIEFQKKDRVDELFKGYMNFIKSKGYVESKLTKTILRSNLSTLNEFNEVRNHKSYAHDNEVLNDLESQLIVNNIINIVYFISRIEEGI